MTIDPDLVDIALDRVSGFQFEKFANAFFPPLLGIEYSPLGGMHDGGADAFGGDVVHERAGRASVFYQASVQQDAKAKIRSTVDRLREFGREPRHLIYLTSRRIPAIDIVEDELGEEKGVVIRIRDASYIRSHVNDSRHTIAAFNKYLKPETAFLSGIGSPPIITSSKHVTSPAVFVFLRQAIDKLDGNVSLVNSVTDSLCLWALEGTDPENNVFMTADQVAAKILEHVPSAASIVGRRVHKRLVAMSKKNYPGGRRVNWHTQRDEFVLPYETRASITFDNQQDEALRIKVQRSLEQRAVQAFADIEPTQVSMVGEVSLRALQLAFEQQGLEFAHFLSRTHEVEYPQIGDAVRSAIAALGVSGPGSVELASQCLSVTRSSLYHSTDDERQYLGQLARTYALLFTLSNEPRLVDYFEEMAADFYLYVGSDMIVRSLSERYLPEQSQLVRNVLLMAAKSGATLVLTEPVLEEVMWNLRSSDLEFENHISGIEHRLTPDMVREVSKILLRAYLYNRTEEHGPTNWPGFVEQFCSYADLHKPPAAGQLRRYLQATFSMSYVSREDLEQLVNPEDVSDLVHELMRIKQKIELAENDALLACSVYGRRKAQKENAAATEFGYRTWWLTHETMILRHSRSLENRHHGARYMMRPDFLLNFFAFAPQAVDVRRSFSRVFPSTLGMQMSRRMDESAFHQILGRVREAEEMEEGRRQAIMAECADRLKSDFERRYIVQMGLG